ncbi:MAG: tRNA lysidine(34) synthetase TilS [Vitreoscilla sp.]|nr:tRNA lysidine(34) synthetase TilS [Burkholderiales bacterium]MBP6337544.1 tRNA lysidine(34) synthetase TilS [Vitreoscilla sp.]MBP6674031.1 tRNA lysidine(34) synthetase TilS [Vitreoscilla sp.]
MTAAARVVAVAASGGRDSTALLHATARAAKALGLQVLALHVHHGLNSQAGAWAAHLQTQCARWRRAGWPVRCEVARLSGAPEPGQSVEAWARVGRYAALARMATKGGATLVLLAHHRRDQAETVLLQALRGAGPVGLAAMPSAAHRQGLTWARPWLHMSSQAVDQYVTRFRLKHIKDDSNLDQRFDRNRLRHSLWPGLLAAFPQAEASLARSAGQSALASAALQEWAAADLPGVAAADGSLDTRLWMGLSAARRWFMLHEWLAVQAPGAPGSLIDRLCAELPCCRSGRWPLLAGHELRLYRGFLRVAMLAAEAPAHASAAANGPYPLALNRQGLHALPPWQGRLQVTRVQVGGLPLALLAHASCRARVGGEAFQSHAKGVPRSLKKQYQAAAVPAWQRVGPLVFAGEQLLWVPGLGPDARALAQAGEPQASLSWLPA